jgi:hypothetical protein
MACHRCKGFMVEEWHSDLSLEQSFWRCVNCGAIEDPTVPIQAQFTPVVHVAGLKQRRAARPVGSSVR